MFRFRQSIRLCPNVKNIINNIWFERKNNEKKNKLDVACQEWTKMPLKFIRFDKKRYTKTDLREEITTTPSEKLDFEQRSENPLNISKCKFGHFRISSPRFLFLFCCIEYFDYDVAAMWLLLSFEYEAVLSSVRAKLSVI